MIDQDETHSNNEGNVGTPDDLKDQLKAMREREGKEK